MSKSITVWKKDHPYNQLKADSYAYRKALKAMSNEDLDKWIDQLIEESTEEEGEHCTEAVKSLPRAQKIKILVETNETYQKALYSKKLKDASL